MYIPGSSGEVPNGTQKWSDPPIILSPSGPPSLYNVTSWNSRKKGYNYLSILYGNTLVYVELTKTLLMLTGPPTLASIPPTVLFIGSGDKRDLFFTYFVVP